ncbi:MAG: Rrf2 family transcriptional regulator [Planctomycetota bacterium]
MRFSTKGRYGIRAMIDLALHEAGRPVSTRSIAERQEFSADYLEQIFRDLRKKGLVRSVRGPRGGFVLARGLDKITVWDIIEALEETMSPAPCAAEDEGQGSPCPRIAYCTATALWNKIGRELHELLAKTTLEDIVLEARKTLKTSPSHKHMFHI